MGVGDDVTSWKKALRKREHRFDAGKSTLEKLKLKTRVGQPLVDLES